MENHTFTTRLFFVCCALALLQCAPDRNAMTDDHSPLVYGPYKITPLSITSGEVITNPIQLVTSPDGRIYGANQNGRIYLLRDTNGDGFEDTADLFCDVTEQGLHSPAGLAFRGDSLYVGTREEIRIYLDRNKDQVADTSWAFFNDIPSSHHPYEWTSALTFGPDGSLYCALTTDSWNAGATSDPKGYRGAIIKVAPDGRSSMRMATGIRSVHGMALHPDGNLFFVDNQGGGNPTEELNRLEPNAFYGHNPKKYNQPDSSWAPALKLVTDLAPSGITFVPEGNNFGGEANDLIVAFYGPAELWENGALARIRIARDSGGQYTYEETALADLPKLSAITFGPRGDLYVASHGQSDYWYNPVMEKTGGLYKISFDASLKGPFPERKVMKENENLTAGSVEKGKELFTHLSCIACHSTDGNTEMLADPLNGIARRMTREEILRSIEAPSEIIKPSMAGMRVTKKDGNIILGRMIHGDEDAITLMLVGNNTLTIPRVEIEKTESETKSLMYEGLIKNLSKEEVDALLDYVSSL